MSSTLLLLALMGVPGAGNGELLRLAGGGQTEFWAAATYPCVVDFDGDGLFDLVGSDRYGTGAVVTWFRNVGQPRAPRFSEREAFPLRTGDGRAISNPNRGWMLTAAVCDWDGDGRRDLLVGGWCRYLTFHKNVGRQGRSQVGWDSVPTGSGQSPNPRKCAQNNNTWPDNSAGIDQRPSFAEGKRIFDAKVLPGLDYGSNPDTPYQGVFIEPCDWDGDGTLDLLCGTYARGRIYFLRATGRDSEGLPTLAPPVALEAGGTPIDFLVHGKPSVGDWDGDGDLDLVAGQYYTEAAPLKGRIAGSYYFENTGTPRHPRLAAGVQIRDATGRLLAEGFHSQPTMLDWNGDGTMDLLFSGAGGTSLYLNRGTPRQPCLIREPIPYAGLAPCRVSNFAYPVACDLDRDGRLDLVVGDGEGTVSFFKGLPDLQYAAPVKIKSAGQPIDEEGCPDGGEKQCGYVKVAVADWNGDGRLDLVMWTNNGDTGWQSGQLRQWCLKFFPGTSDPLDFGTPVEIRADSRSIPAGYRSKPDVADLDGDGRLDLVVACGDGTVNGPCTLMFFRNLGPDKAGPPRLAAGVPLSTGDGRAAAVAVRTAVRLVDWDGDGDLDLFTGNHSPQGVRYWQNVGTRTRPVFAAAESLASVNQIVQSHHEVGVDAVDLDGDGTLDLLIGNGDSGMIQFFSGKNLPRSKTE